MCTLDDIVIEAQNRFDQLEMMLNGLLAENQTDSCFLDAETVLESIDSMIFQADLLEEQRRVKTEKDQPNVESRIRRYEAEFQDLHKRKGELNRKLMDVQELASSAIMAHVRDSKKDIVRDALQSCARLVKCVPTVTKEELDAIFEKALVRACRASVGKFIHSFV